MTPATRVLLEALEEQAPPAKLGLGVMQVPKVYRVSLVPLGKPVNLVTLETLAQPVLKVPPHQVVLEPLAKLEPPVIPETRVQLEQ